MVNQPKRIDVTEVNIGVAGSVRAGFGPGVGTILRRLVNYHNIWFGFSVEPQDADANAQGNWVLWLKPDVTQTDVFWTDLNINAQTTTQFIIACGVWGASNQAPFNFSSQLKSSRNLVANQELVLSIHQTGISAGLSSVKAIICASLSVK